MAKKKIKILPSDKEILQLVYPDIECCHGPLFHGYTIFIKESINPVGMGDTEDEAWYTALKMLSITLIKIFKDIDNGLTKQDLIKPKSKWKKKGWSK